jgi:hypothetical protein
MYIKIQITNLLLLATYYTITSVISIRDMTGGIKLSFAVEASFTLR